MMDVQALKTAYRRDGYVIVPGFMPPADLAALNDRLRDFIENRVPGLPPEHALYEDPADPGTLKQLFSLETYEPQFAKLLRQGPFRAVAEGLLEDGVVPKILEFFNKPPRIGKPTPPHQDNYYFILDPPEAVTMWLALEDVDEENGCVRYVRGSHRRGPRPHGRTQTLGFSQGITDFDTDDDRANAVAVPARAGDLLIHHPMIVHWAEGNQSNTRSRRALGCIYFAESAREDVEAKAAYQQQLRVEQPA